MIRLEPCDLVFTRSKSTLGSLIRFFTRRPLESKTIASHVGVITQASTYDVWDSVIVEAQAHVNRHTMQDAYRESQTELCVFRPLNLTAFQRDLIIGKAESYVGKDYGYLKLGLHLLDWMFGGVYLFRRIGRMDNYPICSYLVANAYKEADLSFGVPSYGASPDDMWDFCLRNEDKYQFVWQRGNMYEQDRVYSSVAAMRS